MDSLAVFDFDRTIVDEDSDASIIRKLQEVSPPPEWEQSNYDWTPYMSSIFEHAYSVGLSQHDILDCIGCMKPTEGILELIEELSAAGWQILILTDANSVFVQHWLKTHGLEDKIKCVITNRAFFKNGRLYIEPCMNQTSCPRCPTNLCKSLALARWVDGRMFRKIMYTGDGRNDFCPAINLPANALVCPRSGYPLDDLIKKTLAAQNNQMHAKVLPWTDGWQIIQELFPNKIVRQ